MLVMYAFGLGATIPAVKSGEAAASGAHHGTALVDRFRLPQECRSTEGRRAYTGPDGHAVSRADSRVRGFVPSQLSRSGCPEWPVALQCSNRSGRNTRRPDESHCKHLRLVLV